MSAVMLAAAFLAGSCLGTTCVAAGEPASTRSFIDGPWGPVGLRLEGRPADPTLILIHQVIWSSAQFRAAQAALAGRGVRTIAIDLPGYGASQTPPTPPTIPEYAEVILAVMEHFGIRSASLLGVNEGGTIASAFADAHPDRVSRLILEGPVIPDSIELAQYFAAPRAYVVPRPDGGHLEATWHRVAASAAGGLSTAGLQEIVQSVYAAGPSGWFAQEAAWRYDLLTVLKRLRVPVTLLSYPGQPFRHASALASAARPDFGGEHLAFDGIAASFDLPDPWADAVLRCLR